MTELQATVRTFEAAGRAGELVADDGAVVRFDAGTLDEAVRSLRPGQRVRALVDGGVVTRLTLAGLLFT